MVRGAGHAEDLVSSSPLNTKVYRHCETRCLKCRQCREFERLIDQIDLENKSELDRQRESDKVTRWMEK
jgi:hypothetical protein